MPLRLTFRLKLLLIVGAALLALLGILATDAVTQNQEARHLSDVGQRLVPKLELGPRLKAEFQAVSRTMLDAVAAEDAAALNEAGKHRVALFELIAQVESIVEPSVAASMRWAVDDYYKSAFDISKRMIAGETGERLVEDVARMQERQAVAQALLQDATSLEKDELARALASIRRANDKGDRTRFGIALAGLLLVGTLSFWVAKSMLRNIANLSDGFTRFATGDFSQKIPVTSADELGDVSREANQMAASLRRLADRRERQNWLDKGRAELSSELSGALETTEVANRALGFLARRVHAVAGAVYLEDNRGVLQLCGHYATSDDVSDVPMRGFAKGEGLVGQAFAANDVLVIDDPPAGYLRFRSGLIDGRPRSLLLVPLAHLGEKVGVLELALLVPSTESVRELLLQAGAVVASGLVVANHAASLRTLLAESQAQAEQLATQEAELRQTNQELVAQQEELQRANDELEEQRGVLHRQNLELEETQRALEENADELSQVSAYKSQFLANMSHELRTPLNSMLLLSQLLAENEPRTLTPKQVEYAEIIHSAGSDLLGLINQVLDLSKIEAGKQSVDLRVVELAHFVNFVQRHYDALAMAKGLTLSSRIEPDMPRSWRTDVERVERVLSNLIGNAIKFTERGEVSFQIARPPPHLAPPDVPAVAFIVSDTGIGISTDNPEQIFAPFEQVDANSSSTGTGLGLAIARESARLLGGDLFFESNVGKGASFICVLPAVDSDSKPPEPRLSNHRSTTISLLDDRERLASNEPYLLIIEDDPVLAEQLADIGRTRRLKVVIVASGKEGMAFARKHRPTGIVLDVNLPDIDGWVVMDRLKRDPVTKHVPVHFVSGVDAAQRGLALGAVGYLVKPVRHEELVEVVQALAPAKSRSMRVMVAEANDAEGAAIVAMLRSERLEADHAATAQVVLELLEQHPYGCVILDLNLPGMDGLSLLETVRDKLGAESPRVVIHTGRALTKKEARQLEAYSEAVILKDGHSAQRLMEEVRLFVRHVTDQSIETLATAPVSAVPPDALKGLTILLVEDDMRTVYVISALLQGKGARVSVAVTGKEALELLDQQSGVDLILMDIMMPEMDGYEAMRRLRKIDRFAQLPVIALTAKAMKGERERCLEAGANDYLTKPIDAETLIATVRTWMKRDARDVS